MAIAFFDLDKTLIARNSATLWIRSELRGGHISRRTALRALGWVLKYHLGSAKMDYALRRGIAALGGLREQDIRERSIRFYHADVKPLYRPGALAALQQHREAGDELALLTTTSNYVSEEVRRELALDGYLCNRFEVDKDGCYTGRPKEPLCFGPGKVDHAVSYAKERGVDLQACSFYTDSASDIPMLEAVGQPVAVNPDPRLKRFAKKRGWPVVDWGSPG